MLIIYFNISFNIYYRIQGKRRKTKTIRTSPKGIGRDWLRGVECISKKHRICSEEAESRYDQGTGGQETSGQLDCDKQYSKHGRQELARWK